MLAKGPRAQKRLHDWIDERSRALDACVADKLRKDPELIAKGLETLDRWERARGPLPVLREWRQILASRSPRDVVALLLDDSEDAARLRQSSPFTGILSPEERLAVFRFYETL
jgi:hypothetical protein